ncbi:MAG: AAA family ATPase [Candidatus Bathyarchaeota archaeon]|nr:AAA family ATPase [Candidatus Bathyarchaeota archaeon]
MVVRAPKTYLQEVILENFMSYEYARIPLKPGVNIICGPNGAGKSSILLGISVALGQSYTERSKRLSDLIRWGKDIGRVTIVLNNSRVKGKRPAPKINKDQIYLSRVLRRDGKYWFEIDSAVASKADVLRLLSRFNVDPDNMLIIMHQDMAEQFILLSPQEKLRLVESAVGLESYRKNVLEAQNKLSRIAGQEESLSKMIESVEQTLTYWREQYDRYQEKKQLMLKRRFLERELAWAEVAKREEEVNEIRRDIENKRAELRKIDDAIGEHEKSIKSLEENMASLREKWRSLLEERIALEREKARYDADLLRSRDILSSLEEFFGEWEKNLISFSAAALRKDAVNTGDFNEAKIFEDLKGWLSKLKSKIGELRDLSEIASIKLANMEVNLLDVKDELYRIERKIDDSINAIIDNKVSLAVLNYKRSELQSGLQALNSSLNNLMLSLNEAVKKAEEKGPRIAVLRSPSEILDEIRVTDGRLLAMAEVSEEVEKMYESYSKLYFELKEKARIAAENREKTLEEIKARMEAWRDLVKSILEGVNVEYQNVLSQVAGSGFVRLVNEEDIEAAGLEIYIGFKGSPPIPLNIYSQSGGERSTATMAFLLALQKHIKSPFRAIDEYDVHMDPRNREIIANLLISAVKDEGVQYLAITPNQMFFEGKEAHIITVQNIDGKSLIREVIS